MKRKVNKCAKSLNPGKCSDDDDTFIRQGTHPVTLAEGILADNR